MDNRTVSGLQRQKQKIYAAEKTDFRGDYPASEQGGGL